MDFTYTYDTLVTCVTLTKVLICITKRFDSYTVSGRVMEGINIGGIWGMGKILVNEIYI